MSTIPERAPLERRDARAREVERLLAALRAQVRERDRLTAGGAGAAELADASAALERLKARLACAVVGDLADGRAG
jgi:predicted phage gp36 major capsid-like protein